MKIFYSFKNIQQIIGKKNFLIEKIFINEFSNRAEIGMMQAL